MKQFMQKTNNTDLIGNNMSTIQYSFMKTFCGIRNNRNKKYAKIRIDLITVTKKRDL